MVDEIYDAPKAASDATELAAGDAPDKTNKSDKSDVAVAVAGSERKIEALRSFIDGLPKMETEEQRARRERREKSKRIIGSVTDGLRAMSNLWFTTEYAPDMYDQERGSQLNRTNHFIEKARAEREKNRDAHLRFALGLGDSENERARTVRELEAEQERRRMAREAAERDADLAPIVKAIKEAQQKKAEQEALGAEYEAKNKPTELELKNETERQRAGSYRASAANSYASAGEHSVVHHFNGKTYRKGTNDYEKDVREAARQYNARHQGESGFVPIEIDREERTANGKKVTARKAEEYAGEVETRLAAEREDNTPPSLRNSK